jgi:hypothetical protein
MNKVNVIEICITFVMFIIAFIIVHFLLRNSNSHKVYIDNLSKLKHEMDDANSYIKSLYLMILDCSENGKKTKDSISSNIKNYIETILNYRNEIYNYSSKYRFIIKNKALLNSHCQFSLVLYMNSICSILHDFDTYFSCPDGDIFVRHFLENLKFNLDNFEKSKNYIDYLIDKKIKS